MSYVLDLLTVNVRVQMKNRGEPEPKKKIIADELADMGSLSPASVEIR